MLDFIIYPFMLIVSLFAILMACELFTNGIEWVGKKLDLSAGATGSILAAVGTALPETSIPVMALLAGNGGIDVAIGAIAGAPFMLSTLGLFVTGAAWFHFSRAGRRPAAFAPDTSVIRRDLGFFLVIYSIAVLATFVPDHPVRYAVAACLVLIYVFYVFQTLKGGGAKAGDLEDLYLSRVFRTDNHSGFILTQVIASLVIIIMAAHYFVVAVDHVSVMLGVPTVLLALIITPVATELPEKMNSILWVRDNKDTLALGNITGAMVFQSSFPVALGVAFTPWQLSGPTMVSALIALVSTGICFVTLNAKKALPPYVLMAGGAFYLAYIIYLLV